MKKGLIALIVIILIILGWFLFTRSSSETVNIEEPATTTQPVDDAANVNVDDASVGNGASSDGEEPKAMSTTVLGTSVEGANITAYHYGTGDTELLFVGGIHGGYAWNTAQVAYEMMDYLEADVSGIPENVKVTIVPVLNPDGLKKTVGTSGRFSKADVPATLDARIPGRFNANNVDLNRNFDCEWQSEGVWQSRTVDGGDNAFSEPESQAIQNYVITNKPDAVVVWYSAVGGVFASNCRGGVLPETQTITNLYAEASGYPAHEEFDFYEITGDMVNWLAKNNIPGISVLLSTHEDVEWEKNRKGLEALLEYYAG